MNDLNTGNILNLAAKNALLLTLVSVVFILIEQLVGFIPTSTIIMRYLIQIIAFVLKFLKVYTCISVLYYLLQKFSLKFPESERGKIFTYGSFLSIFSSIILVTILYIILYFNVDKLNIFIDTVLANAKLDNNAKEQISVLKENFTQIIIIVSFIYYSLFGIICSSIMSRKIRKNTL